MKQNFFSLLCCLMIATCSFCQEEANKKFPGVDNIIQPSPNAGSLGKFGGFDVTKYTGSINKAIEVFNLKSGDITYPVSLAYSSNGVRVDDWGTQTGIGWTIGSHAAITREVRGIADELASYSVRNLNMDLWYEENDATLTRFRNLSTQHATKYDGEYDLFHYNIFGSSGSFIIDNGIAVLLNHSQKVKIDILPASPLGFEITTPDGSLYKFGNPGSTEESKSDHENPCDMGISLGETFVTTAWYLDKIVSPKGDVMNFTYEKSPIPLRMLRSFEERTTFRFRLFEPGDEINCHGFREELTLGTQLTSCAKFRYLYPCILRTVTCPDFTVQYDYTGREDLYDQQLLSEISIKDRSNVLKKSFHLNYIKTVSSQTMEPLLSQNLNSPDFEAQIKIRYFLSSIAFKDRNQQTVNTYSFGYNKPEELSHRFSFSQDIAGYYNAIANANFIPAKESAEYVNSVTPPGLGAVTNVGNRNASPTASAYGLLTKITYPTGGYDSIEYEPHRKISRRTIVAPLIPYEGSHYNHLLTNSEGYTEPFIAQKDEILSVLFYCDWEGPNPPTDDEGDDYYTYFLFNNLTEMEGDYPPADAPGSYRIGHLKQLSVTVQVKAGKQYNFTIGPRGEKTYGVVMLHRASAPDSIDRYNEPLPGQRVKKNIIYSGNNVQEINYEYNHFEETILNGKPTLTLTDSASANVAESFNSFGDFYLSLLAERCPNSSGPSVMVPQVATYYYVTSSPKYSPDVYMGSYIAYSNMLKRYKGPEGQDGFEAYITSIRSNEGGGVIRGDYTPYIPISNLGWDNALQKVEYQGTIKDGIHRVQNNKVNYYNRYMPQNKQYLNYIAFVKNPGSTIYTYQPGTYYHLNFTPYSLVFYPILSTWYKLDSVKTKSYDEFGNALENNTKFEYSTVSAMMKRKETQNSDQKVTISRNIYVDDAENPEEPGLLTDYLLDNGWYGVPIKTLTTMGSQTKSSRFEYEFSNGYPLLDKVTSWQNNNTPITEWKALGYNNKNRLNAYQDISGIKHQFVWDATSSHPISHVFGAVINQGGYASFEEYEVSSLLTGTGNTINTTSSFTGTRSLSINGVITCNNLSNTNEYLVSVWAKNGTPQYAAYNGSTTVVAPASAWQQVHTKNGWTLLQKKISNATSITISGSSGQIDELRIVPADSRLETFTYDALVGSTSKVDHNNQATFYEYDSFGRLERIRDADRNIIKQFQYQYLTYGHSEPVWEATNVKRCKPCEANPAYLSNIQQREEKNMNPNSPAFNAGRWVDIGISADCPAPAAWQNTTTPLRCIKVNGVNTGIAEQEQKDVNPCSSTFNQTRWISAGTNLTACPMPKPYIKLGIYDRDAGTYGNVVAEVYSNSQATNPMTPNNLRLRWKVSYYNSKTGESTVTEHETSLNESSLILHYDHELFIEWQEEVNEEMVDYFRQYTFEIIPDPMYEILL